MLLWLFYLPPPAKISCCPVPVVIKAHTIKFAIQDQLQPFSTYFVTLPFYPQMLVLFLLRPVLLTRASVCSILPSSVCTKCAPFLYEISFILVHLRWPLFCEVLFAWLVSTAFPMLPRIVCSPHSYSFYMVSLSRIGHSDITGSLSVIHRPSESDLTEFRVKNGDPWILPWT